MQTLIRHFFNSSLLNKLNYSNKKKSLWRYNVSRFYSTIDFAGKPPIHCPFVYNAKTVRMWQNDLFYTRFAAVCSQGAEYASRAGKVYFCSYLANRLLCMCPRFKI